MYNDEGVSGVTSGYSEKRPPAKKNREHAQLQKAQARSRLRNSIAAPKKMSVTVEFYGIPRLRAGVEKTVVDFDQPSISLSELLGKLSKQFHEFGKECIVDGVFHVSITANKNGSQFIVDPTTLFEHGDMLLVLSADAGG